MVESSILLAVSRGNPPAILKDAANAYKVDTDAIAAEVKQEFAAKEVKEGSATRSENQDRSLDLKPSEWR